MTDEVPAKSGKQANHTSFKPGYDPRRWMQGRGKKSPEQREGERILRAVIWEELSREFEYVGKELKPLEQTETIDNLRLMVRGMIRNKATQKEILDRIAGKVSEKVEHTGKGGEALTIRIVKASDGTDDSSK